MVSFFFFFFFIIIIITIIIILDLGHSQCRHSHVWQCTLSKTFPAETNRRHSTSHVFVEQNRRVHTNAINFQTRDADHGSLVLKKVSL